jgi:hypothetical protein
VRGVQYYDGRNIVGRSHRNIGVHSLKLTDEPDLMRMLTMTVAQLIETLKQYPTDAEVWVGTDCHGCFEPATYVTLDTRGMVRIDTGDEQLD